MIYWLYIISSVIITCALFSTHHLVTPSSHSQFGNPQFGSYIREFLMVCRHFWFLPIWFSLPSPTVLCTTPYVPHMSDTIRSFVFLWLPYFTEHDPLQSLQCGCKWLSDILLCIRTTSSVSICLLKGISAPSTVWQLWPLLLWTGRYIWPFFSLHLYLWGKYPVVQLQGHRKSLFLILRPTSKVCSAK